MAGTLAGLVADDAAEADAVAAGATRPAGCGGEVGLSDAQLRRHHEMHELLTYTALGLLKQRRCDAASDDRPP